MSKDILQRKRILTKASSGSSISVPVSVANGGTGISSYSVGDLLYASGATTLSKLPIGTANQQLRVNAGATALEYFTPAASGITVGSTTITSGTNKRIPFNSSGVYQEATGFEFSATGTTASPVLTLPYVASYTGSAIAVKSGSTYYPVFNILLGSPYTTNLNVGYNPSVAWSGFGDNVFVGMNNAGNGSNSVTLGLSNTSTGHNNVLQLGRGCTSTASNQAMIGGAAYAFTDLYFNGITHTASSSIILNACGGSGTNNAGASLTLAGGKGTGNATTGGDIIFQTSDVGASGATLQTLTTKFTIKKSGSIEVTKSIDTTSGDSATIDKVAGRFRKDNSGTTFTLTNALITANSIILLTPIQVDLTAISWGVVAGAGSCVITFNAAPTADFDMNFLVIN